MNLASPDRSNSVFGHGAFRLYWSTRVLSTMAFQLQGVAVGWQIYGLTHSVLALGIVGLVQYLPMLVLTLLIGHVADRYDRRRIATVCQLVGGRRPPCLPSAASGAG
jgi:MFS family permease